MEDPKRSLDSEQISPATIAHHTVYEKTPNLHQSHICQWRAQPYLVGPLSRLVGKPPLSPWLSRNVLPLTQAGNDPNTAISLPEIFDRIFLDVCNSLGFRVSKSKKRGSGDNRVYRNLNKLIHNTIVETYCVKHCCQDTPKRAVHAEGGAASINTKIQFEDTEITDTRNHRQLCWKKGIRPRTRERDLLSGQTSRTLNHQYRKFRRYFPERRQDVLLASRSSSRRDSSSQSWTSYCALQ